MGAVARHPKYLLETLSTEEIDDWKAFFQLAPFGPDQLMGMIAGFHADFINANRAEGEPPFDARDLIPGGDAESRWEKFEEVWREELAERREERARQRELAALSDEERNARLQEEFIRSRQASLGIKTDPEPRSRE